MDEINKDNELEMIQPINENSNIDRKDKNEIKIKEIPDEKLKFIENVYSKLKAKFPKTIKGNDFKFDNFYNEFSYEFENIYDLNNENFKKVYRKVENVFVDKHNIGTKHLIIKKLTNFNILNNKTIYNHKTSKSVLPFIKNENILIDDDVTREKAIRINDNSNKLKEVPIETTTYNYLNKSINLLRQSRERNSSNKRGYIKLIDRFHLNKLEQEPSENVLKTDINLNCVKLSCQNGSKNLNNQHENSKVLEDKITFTKLDNVKLNTSNHPKPESKNILNEIVNDKLNNFRRIFAKKDKLASDLNCQKSKSKEINSKSLILKYQKTPIIKRIIIETEPNINNKMNLTKSIKALENKSNNLAIDHHMASKETKLQEKKEVIPTNNVENNFPTPEINKFSKTPTPNSLQNDKIKNTNCLSNFWNYEDKNKKSNKLLVQLRQRQDEDPWTKIIKTDVSLYEKEEEEKKVLNRKKKIEFYNRLKSQIEEKEKIKEINKDLDNQYSEFIKISTLKEEKMDKSKKEEQKKKNMEEGHALSRYNEGK
jgi:hypothetical protein